MKYQIRRGVTLYIEYLSRPLLPFAVSCRHNANLMREYLQRQAIWLANVRWAAKTNTEGLSFKVRALKCAPARCEAHATARIAPHCMPKTGWPQRIL